jgi:hypothetical protein
MPKQPNTRFTRIETDVLKQLRVHCRKAKAVQSEIVSRAVSEYLKRAGRSARRSKTPLTL